MQKIVFALENYQKAILHSKKVEEEKNLGFWAPRRVCERKDMLAYFFNSFIINMFCVSLV